MCRVWALAMGQTSGPRTSVVPRVTPASVLPTLARPLGSPAPTPGPPPLPTTPCKGPRSPQAFVLQPESFCFSLYPLPVFWFFLFFFFLSFWKQCCSEIIVLLGNRADSLVCSKKIFSFYTQVLCLRHKSASSASVLPPTFLLASVPESSWAQAGGGGVFRASLPEASPGSPAGGTPRGGGGGGGGGWEPERLRSKGAVGPGGPPLPDHSWVPPRAPPRRISPHPPHPVCP